MDWFSTIIVVSVLLIIVVGLFERASSRRDAPGESKTGSTQTASLETELARQAREYANDQAERIMSMMKIFLAVLALVGGFGIFQVWNTQKKVSEIEDLRERAEASWQKVQDRSKQVMAIPEGLGEVLKDVDRLFPGLRENERTWMVGGESPAFDAQERVVLQDGDRAIVLADQLNLFATPENNQHLAEQFVRLGVFWRNQKEFARAARRLERAIELAPQESRPRLQLSRTLAYQGAMETTPELEKNNLLTLAKASALRAHRLQGHHDSQTLHTLGWIYDEEGDYREAIAFYRQARKLDRAESATAERDIDALIAYNLCCSLAKSGDLEGTLKELEVAIPETWSFAEETWRFAETDPDFAPLRKSRRLRKRFLALVTTGRTPG